MMANALIFKYTNNVSTVLSIPLDDWGPGFRIDIVGDPATASYEWVVIDDEGVVEGCSDDGYGIPEVALRDALIFAYGAPNA